jgi:hypothetical protein
MGADGHGPDGFALNAEAKRTLRRENESSLAARIRLIQRGVQIHYAAGGDVSHALFELFWNPGFIGFDYEFSHLRPLVRWQGFNLLNNVLRAHGPNVSQEFSQSKRTKSNAEMLKC